jgi:hypothetical protein
VSFAAITLCIASHRVFIVVVVVVVVYFVIVQVSLSTSSCCFNVQLLSAVCFGNRRFG